MDQRWVGGLDALGPTTTLSPPQPPLESLIDPHTGGGITRGILNHSESKVLTHSTSISLNGSFRSGKSLMRSISKSGP